MTLLDTQLAELAAGVDRLPRRAVAAFFWACARSLVPVFEVWARDHEVNARAVLSAALAGARGYAIDGVEPDGAASLLAEVEAATPSGDAPGPTPAAASQDCWICADTAIRVVVDRTFNAGPAVEYALEPVLSSATEELFGVSQLGASVDEDARLAVVLRHPRVASAVAFCNWAVGWLKDRDAPSEADLAVIEERARALVPWTPEIRHDEGHTRPFNLRR